MALLKKNKLSAAFDSAKAIWNNALKTVTATWTDWAGKLNSETDTETYEWAELLVVIREWIGDRVIGNVKGEEWIVKNKKYEGSFGLGVDDINDDKLSLLKPQTEALLGAARLHPENLLMDVVLAGYTTACYDGQLFFDTDHPSLADDGTTFSNLSTDPFGYDALMTADVHRYTMKNAQKNRLTLEPVAVLVGSANLAMAQKFYDEDKKPGTMNESNQLKGKYKPVYCDRFEGAYAAYWVVLYAIPGNSLRAFIYQGRTEPDLYCTAMNNVGNDMGVAGMDAIQFMEDKVLFGTDFRGAATFTLPVLARASVGTGA